jgi:hypothetical protein
MITNSQNLTKSDFYNTEWFANNDENNFYKSDTVSLIRITNFNTQNDKWNEVYIKLDYNNQQDIIDLDFNKNGVLKTKVLDVSTWNDVFIKSRKHWRFDEKGQYLKLYSARKLYAKFRIINKLSDSIQRNYESFEKKIESNLNIVILRLKRIE